MKQMITCLLPDSSNAQLRIITVIYFWDVFLIINNYTVHFDFPLKAFYKLKPTVASTPLRSPHTQTRM